MNELPVVPVDEALDRRNGVIVVARGSRHEVINITRRDGEGRITGSLVLTATEFCKVAAAGIAKCEQRGWATAADVNKFFDKIPGQSFDESTEGEGL